MIIDQNLRPNQQVDIDIIPPNNEKFSVMNLLKYFIKI